MSRVAVMLAAGSSRRWGAANKLFAHGRGQTMLARSLGVARAAPVTRVIVAVGWQADRVARAARGARTRIVRLRDHHEGLGASLRAAHAALRPHEREVLLFLADMPWLDPRMAARLLRAARPYDTIVRPSWRGRPGHPVLLRARAVAMLADARGDAGPGRGAARFVPADRRCVADADRPSALHRRVPALR